MLIPCLHCSRHARYGEAVCPFCQGVLPPAPNVRRRDPDPTLSRAAQLAFTIVLAGVTGARCTPARSASASTSAPTSGATASDAATGDAASILDADVADVTDAASERAAMVAIYGAPGPPVLEQVRFALNDTKLDADDLTLLDAVAEVLRHELDYSLEIEGHADPGEKPGLAKKRASNVQARLIKLRIARERLVLRDYDSSRPVTASSNQVNARVSLWAFEHQKDAAPD